MVVEILWAPCASGFSKRQRIPKGHCFTYFGVQEELIVQVTAKPRFMTQRKPPKLPKRSFPKTPRKTGVHRNTYMGVSKK